MGFHSVRQHERTQRAKIAVNTAKAEQQCTRGTAADGREVPEPDRREASTHRQRSAEPGVQRAETSWGNSSHLNSNNTPSPAYAHVSSSQSATSCRSTPRSPQPPRSPPQARCCCLPPPERTHLLERYLLKQRGSPYLCITLAHMRARPLRRMPRLLGSLSLE